MNRTKKAGRALDDKRIHVKIKLSALWAAVMFCYIYGDVFRLFQHGELQAMLDGKMWGLPVTQGLLVGTSAFIAIPSIMVFLSLVLRPGLNRWANILFGVIYTGTMLYTMMYSGPWAFYIFLGFIEVTLTVLIVWHAWTWPRQGEA